MKVCIPAKTELRGMGREGDNLIVRVSKANPEADPKEEQAAKEAALAKAKAAAANTNTSASTARVNVEPKATADAQADTTPAAKAEVPSLQHAVAGCEDWPLLYTDVVYTVIEGAKSNRLPDRFGLTYGALVVPYKYHFEGSKSFKGNGTVGPFVGYRWARNNIGVAVKTVVFVGASVIEVDREADDGSTKKESLAGFSYGAGLIGVLKNEFQLGLVFGADKVSNDSDYEDDGKLWGAVAIGFSFGT